MGHNLAYISSMRFSDSSSDCFYFITFCSFYKPNDLAKYCMNSFMDILKMWSLNSEIPQIRKMFNKADKNGDGKLTPQEWFTVLNSSGIPTSR